MPIGGQCLDFILKLLDEVLLLYLLCLDQALDSNLEIVVKPAQVHPPEAARANQVSTCFVVRKNKTVWVVRFSSTQSPPLRHFFKFFFSTSLCLVGNSGHLTWIRHSSCKSRPTHSYQCVQCFHVSKQ